MVRLAHSYPDGAPLVAITGQVGTDRLHIPVVNTMMAKGIIPMDDKYSLCHLDAIAGVELTTAGCIVDDVQVVLHLSISHLP